MSTDEGFTRYKSKQVVTWTLANLPRLTSRPSVGLMGQPFAGRTVFVVGAGPSLAGNIDALREHAERGHPIVCVNAAGAPLEVAGIRPDVMVARESLDLTDQIEATDARVIAVDIAIHPDTWIAAGERLAWFIPMYPRQADIAYLLGEPMIAGGPAAFCSAVAISLHWGAARIVLVGCDLAFARDGTAYHPDAPRGTLRHETKGEGDTARLTFSGDEQDDERCARSGQMAPPKSVKYTEVMAHDWSTWLPTINVYQDQRTWLGTQAERHGERVELLNATEGGSGVPGWQSVELKHAVPQPVVLATVPPGELDATIEALNRFSSGHIVVTSTEAEVQIIPPEPVTFDLAGRIPEHRLDAAIEYVRAGAATQEQCSREMLSNHGPDLRALASIPMASQGAPMAEALSAAPLLERPGGTAEAKIEFTYTVMRGTAQQTQNILRRKT